VFVSRKKYDAMKMEYDALMTVAVRYATECRALKIDKVVMRQRIVELTRGATRQACNEQFSQDEIRSLLMLVHPDKHDGKESAKVMTQKLLRMRK
jgi:hypothetical protein